MLLLGLHFYSIWNQYGRIFCVKLRDWPTCKHVDYMQLYASLLSVQQNTSQLFSLLALVMLCFSLSWCEIQHGSSDSGCSEWPIVGLSGFNLSECDLTAGPLTIDLMQNTKLSHAKKQNGKLVGVQCSYSSESEESPKLSAWLPAAFCTLFSNYSQSAVPPEEVDIKAFCHSLHSFTSGAVQQKASSSIFKTTPNIRIQQSKK